MILWSFLCHLDCASLSQLAKLSSTWNKFFSCDMTFVTSLRIAIVSFVWLAFFVPCPIVALGDVQWNPKMAKAISRLETFSSQINNKKHPKILMIDGNNVRGVARMKWDYVEVYCRVNTYCRLHSIDHSVIVWDHGNVPFAAQLDELSLLLFSGPSHRADDIIVNQVDDLTSFFQKKYQKDVSIAIITNDKGLTDRIRKRQSAEMACSKREEHDLMSRKVMTMDSSRFVEILSAIHCNITQQDLDVQQSLQETTMLLAKFKAKLRHGLNKRHEKTWERIVLTESLRRSIDSKCQSLGEIAVLPQYLEILKTKGFQTIDPSDESNIRQAALEFRCPTRLDKRQRQILGRFQFWTKRVLK